MNKFKLINKEQYIKDFDNDCCTYEELKLPKRATKGSAGYDFYSTKDFRLRPRESIKLPTGIRAQLDDDKVLLIYPRSGLGFKYRLQLDNGTGVIDSDYFYSDNHGHINIKLTNDSTEGNILEIKKGEAIAQGVITYFVKTDDDCTDGVRNGGFGSTSASDYSLPVGYDMYDMCHCTAKCKTPCGCKGKPAESVFASSDFATECTRFGIDLDQFECTQEAVHYARSVDENKN